MKMTSTVPGTWCSSRWYVNGFHFTYPINSTLYEQEMGCGYSTTNVIDEACGGATTSADTVTSPATSPTGAASTTNGRVPETITSTSIPSSSEPGEEVPPTVSVTIPSFTGTSSSESVTAIVVHFNPSKYVRRAVLVNECIQHLVETQLRLSDVPNADTTNGSPPPSKKVGLDITVVELCYGSDEPQIDPNNYPTVKTICCRCDAKHKMWSKEQLINIALDDQYLSPETRYVAWIDSDIAFTNDSWVNDVAECLSKHDFAFGQIWSTCEMLGPEEHSYEPKVTVTSFCAQYAAGKSYAARNNTDREYWHPGFAWMATVAAVRATQGLISQTLGSADRHMAMSFLGSVIETVPDGLSEGYLDQVLTWQEYVKEHKIELVHVPCHIQHFWHGPMKQRKYMERFEILKKHKFDPRIHLRHHYTGLYLWTESCPLELLQDVASYFDERLEDSTIISDDAAVATRSDDNDGWKNSMMDDGPASATTNDETAAAGAAAAAAVLAHAQHTSDTTSEPTIPSDPLNIYA
jgi:hypothetical protein